MSQFIKIEFKRQLSSLILWTAIICGLSILMLSMYPAFKDSFSELEAMLDAFPPAMLEVFGLGEGGLDMSTPYGWYGMEGYLFVVLIGGSYAGILGSTILSQEEDDQTIEFLLSKPISRNQILFGKSLVVVTNLFILNMILFVTLVIAFSLIGDFIFLSTLLLVVGPFLLQLIFASLSLAISIFVTKSRKVMSVSLGLVIGLFFLDIIATLTDNLNFLKYFTPYEYVNAVSIVNNQAIEFVYLIISVVIIIVSGFVTWFFYNRKDITA
ncbi:MAG: ABC transporter permease subunit [Tenericutes bacterium]|jgi:ABC-2 type transport system permease protein|nr:ABC transporter permease subunit [Mycoplasmatota bacterium]